MARESLERLSTLWRLSDVSSNVMKLANRPTQLPKLQLALFELLFILFQSFFKCLVLLSKQVCLSRKVDDMAEAT